MRTRSFAFTLDEWVNSQDKDNYRIDWLLKSYQQWKGILSVSSVLYVAAHKFISNRCFLLHIFCEIYMRNRYWRSLIQRGIGLSLFFLFLWLTGNIRKRTSCKKILVLHAYLGIKQFLWRSERITGFLIWRLRIMNNLFAHCNVFVQW